MKQPRPVVWIGVSVWVSLLLYIAFFAPDSAGNEKQRVSRQGELTVREVTLPQGGEVQCVVFEYPYYPRPGGISCNWSNVR